jgi:DNA polymerase III subunit beta
MKFLVKRDFLGRMFKFAYFVSAEKKIGSVLVGTHVLLIAKQQKLALVATDLDEELIIEEVLETIEEEGSAVIPFRKISEICRAMTDNVDLLVRSDIDYKLHIESKYGFFSISYRDPKEFPLLNQKMFYASFEVKTAFLRELISKTCFSIGEDDNRQFLNGVFLCFSNKEMVSVATDGHRLTVFDAGLNEDIHQAITNLNTEIKVLLPRKSAMDLLKILGDSVDDFLKIHVGENHVRVECSLVTFTSKLLSGAFPVYQRLIPNGPNILIANKETLKAGLLRAAALLGDKSQGVQFVLSPNNLQLTAKNDCNDAVQENVLVNYKGCPLEICFNIKYILDFLSNIDGETVCFKMENAVSGVLLQDQFFKSSYILMPMQLC